MKFTTALALCAAPLAMAKAVHNVYPVRREFGLSPRESKGGKEKAEKAAGNAQQQAGNAQQQAGAAANAQLAAAGMSGVGITTNAAAGGATEVIVIWVNPGNGAATTNVNPQQIITNTVTVTAGGAATPAPAAGAPAAGAPAAAAPAAAAAVTHQVTVGGAAGLQFTPAEIKAAVGDMVIFTFMSANHTATQSAFATPCQPLAGGMDSGFQANPNNTVNPPPQVAMQVMVATPLWFFCAQKGHCGKGMTFSINPSADKTQAMFQSMAIAQNGTGAPSAITGGTPAAAPAAAAPAAAAPAAAAPAAAAKNNGTAAAAPAAGAAAGGNIVSGTGTVSNGACVCAVTCSTGSFPAVQAQGVGAFGGLPGALPATMAEV